MHARQAGRRQRLVDPARFEGVAGFGGKVVRAEPAAGMLLRPLAEYEAVAGGGF